jgi:hypothetical protein
MPSLIKLLVITSKAVLLILLCMNVAAQKTGQDYLESHKDHLVFNLDSITYYIYFSNKVCKQIEMGCYIDRNLLKNNKNNMDLVSSYNTPNRTKKFLQVHGNILYEYIHQSRVDTPFYQKGLEQHYERITLDILIKENYPFRIAFNSRQSNSPFVRNYFDPIINFDPRIFAEQYKKQLISKTSDRLSKQPELLQAKVQLNAEKEKLAKINSYLKNPGTLQKLVEEREYEYKMKLKSKIKTEKEFYDSEGEDTLQERSNTAFNKFSKVNDFIRHIENIDKEKKLDSVNFNTDEKVPFNQKHAYPKIGIIDSTSQKMQEKFEDKKNEAELIKVNIEKLKHTIDSIENQIRVQTGKLIQDIQKVKSEKDLKSLSAQQGIVLDSLSGIQKFLLNLKSFQIGRNIVNHSELTAKNIVITGINVEYNPSYYLAFSVGKIAYRFRDFSSNKERNRNDQYLAIGRFGWGIKDRKAIIVSFFKGRKNQSEFVMSDTVRNSINLFGYSIEAILKKDENNFISAEFAKSTKPIAGNFDPGKQNKPLWQMNDQSNMGINVNAQTYFKKTDTRFNGFIRKSGENFQSFSLFTINSNQLAWQAKVTQTFYKRRISITTSLRRNDFVNPYIERNFVSSTVFKTFLMQVRLPKYPIVSFGYFPGSQFVYLDKQRISENVYYILNGSVVYPYTAKRINMISSIVYNRFLNKASDSGFIYNRGISYTITQGVLLKKLQTQVSFSFNEQPELKYITAEGQADYTANSKFKIGAGLKYNETSTNSTYIGYRGMLGIEVRFLGGLQFQYEKSYLPAPSGKLIPMETGRLSWLKIF